MGVWNTIARPRHGRRLCAISAGNAKPKFTWLYIWSDGRERPSSTLKFLPRNYRLFSAALSSRTLCWETTVR